jgi:hypothetical protein
MFNGLTAIRWLRRETGTGGLKARGLDRSGIALVMDAEEKLERNPKIDMQTRVAIFNLNGQFKGSVGSADGWGYWSDFVSCREWM